MAFRLVHSLDVEARQHRLALDRLRDAIPKSDSSSDTSSSLTSNQYIVLKRMTELYLKQLGLHVLLAGILMTELAAYARELGRRTLDLIVDLHDPDAPDINATTPHLKLSAEIDDMVADEYFFQDQRTLAISRE